MYPAVNNVITSLNGVGQVFWNYAAGVFFQSSVLIVFLLAADFLLRKRLRAVFRYCVWMLVFVKLVLPTSFALPTGIGYWLGFFSPVEYSAGQDTAALEEAVPLVMPQEQTQPTEAVVFEPPVHGEPPIEVEASVVHAAKSPPIEPVTYTASTDAGPVEIELEAISWQGLVLFGWLVGMLVLSVLLVQRACFVRGLLAQAREADSKVRNLLNRCRADMGISKELRLKVSDTMSSPAVCGLFRPTILLPRYLVEQLSEERLRVVVLHECAHIKRWDLWVNLVQTVLQIVYFYNPFLWLANARVRQVREQAVDETVLVALRGQSESYSDILIDIGEMAFWRPNFSLRLIGVVESKKALAARIKHIAHRPIPKTAKLGIVGAIAVVLTGAVLLPMARAERWTSEPSYFESHHRPIDQPIESMIYWTDPDSRRILSADLDGTSVKQVVSTETALFDVALDLVHRKVYWTEPDARLIKRANLDGSHIEVVAEDLENPTCIALDTDRHKIYWTDLEGGRIRRANLDGSHIEDLIATGLGRPEGICLDTARGRIYWTDIGTKKIQRANLDGTYVEDLVTSEVKYPRGIVLDIAAEKMYWTDLFPPRIRRANLDGSRIEDVIKAEELSADARRDELYVDYVDPDKVSGLYDYGAEAVLRDPDILRLHLEAGKMYWTDLYKRKVLCANLDGTGVREVITGYGPRGIDLALSVPVSVLGARARTSRWSAPAKLGPAINTEYDENYPYLSADGESLYFNSNRPGGYGSADIYVARKIDGAWQRPENLGPVINSAGNEAGPMLSYDGQYLFFWSDRMAGPSTMLFVSKVVDGRFHTPEPLPYFINSALHTDEPFLTADGQLLYFQTFGRDGNIRIRDLWCSGFSAGEFERPVNLGPVVNRFARQKSPSLTADGRYLYYIYEMADKSTGIVVAEKVRQNFTNPVEIEFPSLAELRAVEPAHDTVPERHLHRASVKDETQNTRDIVRQQEERYPAAPEIERRRGESDPGYPRGYIDSAKISWSGKALYFSMKDGNYDIWYAQKQSRRVAVRPQRDRWVDILELIDVERDTKGGEWRREDGTLIGFAQSTLQTTYELPAEYDVLWEFSSNSTAIDLLLASPLGKRFEWMMKGWSHRLCGIREVDCKPVNANETTTTFPLESGVRYVAEVRVRKDRFVALINGEEVLNYRTDWSDIEVCLPWHPFELQGRRLGLWLNKHWTKTYRLQVRPHSGGRGVADNLVVPGTRVGEYAIGISKDDVLKSLGKPRVIFYSGEKYTLDNLPRRYFMVYDDIAFGVVDDSVEGVSALSSLYKFANGLGVGDSEQKIKQAFGDNYRFKETEGKDFLTYEDQGIQFEIDKNNRTVMEISVFRKTGQRDAGPTVTEGVSGNAYYFDGEGDFINIDESDSLDISADQITVSAWIKAETFDKRQVIAAKTGWGDNSWLVEINPIDCDTGRLNFYLQAGGREHNFCSDDAISSGSWHHVAFVYDGHEKIIYINGKFSGSQPWSGDISTNDQPVRIAAWGDPIGPRETRYFNGAIDQVAIYNRALSAGEIGQLYYERGRLEGNERGLVGYWDFDGDDGHTVVNRSRYGNHGRILHRPEDYYARHGWASRPQIGGVVGGLRDTEPSSPGAGPELTDGISGKAYYFDGRDDMIEIPESDSLDISGKEITVSAWIKAKNLDRRQVIAAKNALGINSWILEINPIDFSEGHINFYLDLWGIDGNFGSKTPVTADTWYHVAGVYNGDERRIYINGRFDASQMVSREIPTNDQPVTIGGWGSPSRYFNGTIDDVALFDRALSDYEIKQLYENAGGLTDDTPGLVGYWNFDGDDGDTVVDRSRYGNHGKLSGGSTQHLPGGHTDEPAAPSESAAPAKHP